jgi:homoserine O-acetyltransferase/O-succinyltransferase
MRTPSSRVRALLSLASAAALAPALAAPAGPASYPDQKEGDFAVKDFKLQDGEVLAEARLHYTTLGTPRRDGAGRVANAVLMLHGTTGTGKNFLAPNIAGELFGPGQPLDASRFFIILPDGLGRGGSSKPSDGLHARFPRYGYADVVEAQHLLVTKGLGVDHLRAVVGTSMGGMQAWMWGERWPEMMDALMPIASQPVQISGRNLVWRRLVAETIRHDPDWKGGDYDAPPRNWTYAVPVFLIMTDSPVRLQKQGPTRKEAEALYDKTVEEARKKFDANDYLYWYESSWDYDPEPDLPRIKARLLAVNFADDEINPPETGVMERAMPKVKNGRFVLVPRGDKTIGHQTLTLASVWKPYLEELLRDAPRAER